MGLETHALNLVRYISRQRPLGQVLMIGRQELDLPAAVAQQYSLDPADRYCENLLGKLGAEVVHSLDVSDYEGATIIRDLNSPFEPERTYDTVLDFGSLEHVFNQAVAFRNVANLARQGGLVCHVLPVNNLSGHGFWQYCSDLLYEIYSVDNGFEETEVFYASSMDHRWWYRVERAGLGVRTQFASIEPIILLTCSRKTRALDGGLVAQQKFYDEAWSKDETAREVQAPSSSKSDMKRRLQGITPLYLAIRNAALVLGLLTGTSRHALSHRRPAYARLRVSDLVSTGLR